MDIHTATEMAYKNGYARAVEELRGETFWIEKENKYICKKCKSQNEKMTKYCPNCGRLVFQML